MTPQMYIMLILSAVAAVFIAIHFVAAWMERRGWIYYRKRKSQGGGSMAGLLNEFQKIVEPQVEHRIQVMEERNESIGQRLGRGDGLDDSLRAPASPTDACASSSVSNDATPDSAARGPVPK